MSSLIDQARQILRANDLDGYTVPTRGLYPYQWNWDAGFTALGWITFDEVRAWRELERLFEGQWDDGLVPHIIFHKYDPGYFPGPDVWGTRHTPPTSGISQPPVAATVVRLMLEAAGDQTLAEAKAKALYPRLLAYHRWWQRARDPENTGLVVTYHPWETGADNSIAWDAALARVPATKTEFVRRDTQHVDQSMRPHRSEYQRYIYLVELFRSLDWQPQAMYEQTPFKIADTAINAILQRANLDLAELARRFGRSDEAAELQERADHTRRAFAALWNAQRRVYQPYDRIAGQRIDVPSCLGMLPLWGRVPDETTAKAMMTELERWAQISPFLVPSSPPDFPGFESKRYWRGPAWLIINFMIADGLAHYSYPDLAERIRQSSEALIETGGFHEYFDPLDGSGCGGKAFSWTASMGLYWIFRKSG